MTSNVERGRHAEAALTHYFAVKNPGVLPFDPESEGQETLIDLLADLRHWSREKGLDFEEVARMAEMHFEAEADEEQAEEPEGGDAQ
ncbi:MAG: hypothetical protein WC869_11250 [Phycisphaerae bacterium]|jgi:hypothetical protein